jgi:asparagine synthase (glutamine-hydrolysing)
MCGIAGAYQSQAPRTVRRMVEQLKHRGPDGEGVKLSENATLGHTRLAILDVAGGAQPLHHGPAWISFNGEIYNYVDLRRRFLDHEEFQTHTDTEVVLRLYLRFGSRCVEMLDGMFAFAIAARGGLFLARDPLGIKPLYFGEKAGKLYFASEVKALSQVTGKVKEFPAGYWFSSKDGWHRYYTVEDTLKGTQPQALDKGAALTAIRTTLQAAVRKRLMSDVPLGISLSGGLDSSIVSLLASQDVSGLHSFAVGVDGSQDLEAARLMARFLSTCHHEFVYTEQEMLEALPEVVYYLESFEPALVRSAIPNYFLARMASDYVKVVLTGEGADELFAGYSYLDRYQQPEALQDELVSITEALHNTNLQRGDRMSMAHGLEARVPFLDVKSVALALSLPTEWKLHRSGHPAKSLLRRAFEGHLPRQITYRPKMKFSKGAGSSDMIAQHAEETISDGRFVRERDRLQHTWGYELTNKEALFYHDILRQHYQDEWILPTMGHSRSL